MTFTVYKCTRPNNQDFHTNTVDYSVGKIPVVADPSPACDGECGRGLHVSRTWQQAVKYRNGKWIMKECAVDPEHVIIEGSDKLRVSQLRVVRDIPFVELYGAQLYERIKEARVEAETWKTIPWFKPNHVIADDEIRQLLAAWRNAIQPWHEKTGRKIELPRVARIVRTRAIADAADAAVADAAVADAADAADAAADAADAAVADADADAVAVADADAADADAAADAAAVADAADAADADAADADATFYRLWNGYWYRRWYVRPRYTLWRMIRWDLTMHGKPNPWAPMVALYKLGCMPIGYVTQDGKTAFVVYAPEPAALEEGK